MSDQHLQPESDQPVAEAAAPSRLRRHVAALRTAAIVHWRRTIALAVTVALLMMGIGLAWTYTVSLAMEGERGNLDKALAALDKGQYEQARTLVRHVLNSGATPPSEHGAPLFILGAVKTNDASNEVVPAQRWTQYLVASRYLNEARSYGLPPGREKQGLLLLGKSLVETSQVDVGIEVLADALAVKPSQGGPLNVAILRLLAEAYMRLPEPKFEEALAQLGSVLDDKSLAPEQQVDALIFKAKILVRLDRHDEAKQTLAAIPPEAARPGGARGPGASAAGRSRRGARSAAAASRRDAAGETRNPGRRSGGFAQASSIARQPRDGSDAAFVVPHGSRGRVRRRRKTRRWRSTRGPISNSATRRRDWPPGSPKPTSCDVRATTARPCSGIGRYCKATSTRPPIAAKSCRSTNCVAASWKRSATSRAMDCTATRSRCSTVFPRCSPGRKSCNSAVKRCASGASKNWGGQPTTANAARS